MREGNKKKKGQKVKSAFDPCLNYSNNGHAIEGFLKIRDLELSEEKTMITHIDDGFDFLGFNVRKYKGWVKGKYYRRIKGRDWRSMEKGNSEPLILLGSTRQKPQMFVMFL